MSIEQMCASQVDTISAEDTVQTAAVRMRDHLVGCLVVCDDQNRPIGMLTDRDLATTVVAGGMDTTDTLIADVMSESPRTVPTDTTLEALLSTMQRVPCRRVPVVDNEGKLVALATLDDVLAEVGKRFGQIGNLVRQESPAALDAE